MGKIQLWSEVLAPGAPYNRKEISVGSFVCICSTIIIIIDWCCLGDQ